MNGRSAVRRWCISGAVGRAGGGSVETMKSGEREGIRFGAGASPVRSGEGSVETLKSDEREECGVLRHRKLET